MEKSNGTPLQSSCLENPMDGGAWWAAVHGVTKSPTGLSDFTFTFHFHTLEKEMAAHSSVLAWRIQGRGSLVGLWGRTELDTTESTSSSSRDLFKKIGDTKGTFRSKMVTIKDRNGMDLTEVEDIKKTWQKKDLHDPDNRNGVITHLEPDILE